MSDAPSHCPCCGQLNQCAQAASASPVTHCWCFSVKVDAQQLANVPAELRNRSCLCPRCAQGLPPDSPPATN
ncbi:cysteine-rich CWC family protein [Pseudomonas spirodelae]|uniref:Cysteine-rich CWC family protein n=1 Tax=Pseudomonas spirodelae TaxID=3101751 RepID=A0ABU5P4E5_9PSED|nr:cysteine-rich CWC family protein [Pseudomonas sp. T5W1]MBU0808992.1 cysteine-rich CWC family protein [Gammaproteobacteria bacterium]MBU0883064.1 cysteine-rich CWC family protein [Gammaproteobacteria bacterium]MBU1859238.1 cysteine-rich CWC family protein [Gammaproteobacteria bacterium]MEA1604517.1 cysteine-rich CWC family protein [Pseudomonas sp. T5W1]